jgi:hypothetical protein
VRLVFNFLASPPPHSYFLFTCVYVRESPRDGTRGLGRKKEKKKWGGEVKKKVQDCACVVTMEIDTNNDLLEWRIYN